MKLFKKMIEDRGKKGFTLVEMLIVLALLAILLSVAVPSFSGYVRRIKLMELDDSARAIFMAVQNKMTVMKQSGANIEELGTAFDESNLPKIFKAATEPTPDPANPADPATPTNYVESKPMYAFSSEVAGEGSNHLVSLNAIEGQLYNHNYVIEYDATTGRVFGVFYSEEENYLIDNYLTKYKEDSSRAFETRLSNNELVGYYGGVGELVKVPTGGAVEKPEMYIGNMEKLVVNVAMPEGYTGDKLYFSLKITDANNDSNSVVIVPYEGSDKKYYITKDKAATIILDSLAPGCCDDKGVWSLPENADNDISEKVYERDFKGWVYKGEQTGNFSASKNGLSSWNPSAYPWDKNEYVINPGSDIKIEVLFFDKNGNKLDAKEEKTVNSYFAALNGTVADISAGRHLQNLGNFVDYNLVSTGSLINDIDFSKSERNDYNSWNSNYTYEGTPGHEHLYNFKPFEPKKIDGSLRAATIQGNGKQIKYLRIDTRESVCGKKYENTGIYTNVDNQVTATSVTFYCPVVKGEGNTTGMFFGYCENGTNISNVTVINPIIESSGTYVGGLFGQIEGGGNIRGHEIYVEEVDNYFDNYSDDYRVRGLKGKISWNDPEKDPYSMFCIRGLDINTYAGGLVGHTVGSIYDSGAAIRVDSRGYAGGIVGLAGGSISKCHVGGHTYRGSFMLPGGKYLVNIMGDVAAGGLAAKLEGQWTNVEGSYTTCSVGSLTTGKADTFIAISDKGEQTFGNNRGYAIGTRIDVTIENNIANYTVNDNSTVWKTSAEGFDNCTFFSSLSYLLEYDVSKPNTHQLGKCDAYKKYDSSLSEEFPYYISSNTGLPHHLGDWPIVQTNINGYGMFYWEKENDAYYNIKAVGNIDGEDKTVSILCDERDAQPITDYGYGYFYSEDITDVDNVALGGQEVTDDALKNKLRNAGLNGVEFKLLPDSIAHADQVFTFTGKQGETDISKQFHYNPDFCALSESALTDYEYEIRSFEQLNNLSTNSSYWGKKFKLSHDIPFDDSAITPIGVSGTPFTGEFDGHLYRIVDAKLTASGSDAGVFGCVDGATINGVVVFNADYSLSLAAEAAVGGVIGKATDTSITNCAFTGKVSVSSDGNIAAGGIVGIADGDITLSNCQAVMSDDSADADMTVTGSGVVAAGGIVGKYHNKGVTPIQNCYSGGFISANGSDNIFVGGIVGNKANTAAEAFISNCYTYYQTNFSGAHPICIDNSTGAAKIHYTNCYYLGGDWFNQNVEIPEGIDITSCDSPEALESSTNGLRDNRQFGEAKDRSYISDLKNDQFTYELPATISEPNTNGEIEFYHYGKSPDGTLVLTGDKHFGVFYWENEGGDYKLKVCYYDKPGDTYQYQTKNTLCDNKDGQTITNYGYGYFIGKGVKNNGMNGFSGLDSSKLAESSPHYTSVVASLATALGAEATGFKLGVYDCSNYTDPTNITRIKDISVISDDEDINGKKFTIIPGLCAINSGESSDREVRTVQHLRNVSNEECMTKDFVQTHDIIFNETDAALTPIGSEAKPFTGEYNGGCYRIHNVKVNGNGLFGEVKKVGDSKANIHDTFVIGGNIIGSGNIGGIVGRADGATIQNCIYTGTITQNGGAANPAIGGLVGNCNGGTLSKCEATANITVAVNGTTVGGIVGSTNVAVTSCYSGGTVTLGDEHLRPVTVGGIVGSGNGNDVRNCYTHMNIPKIEFADTSAGQVNPIGNGVNPSDCHYIESKNHYANDVTQVGGITKHVSFDKDKISIEGFSQPKTANTYPTGLTVDSANPYPMPAVVKDKDTFVHYGTWQEIVPLYAPGYGVFYWEKEGGDYRVRVCGIKKEEDGSYAFLTDPAKQNDCNFIESEDFCYEKDCTRITDYGYGYYYYNEVEQLDTIAFNYSTFVEDDAQKTAGITNALKDLGIAGVVVKWGQGNVIVHKDYTMQLKLKQSGEPLKVNNQPVNFKYNLDFCYLKMWTGDENNEPSDGDYKYEIRNDEHFAHIGIAGGNYGGEYITQESKYLNCSYIQTHDIYPSGEYDSTINPIGRIYPEDNNTLHAFKGRYNGNGYRLIDYHYSSEDNSPKNYVGLFGYTDGATIENVTMFNANINVGSLDKDSSNDRIGAVGGIIGFAKETTIQNCAITGIVNVKTNNDPDFICYYAIGGIVGHANGCTITNCASVTDFGVSFSHTTIDKGRVGGIAGKALGNSNISYCYSGGTTICSDFWAADIKAGGIVGGGLVTVDKCYSFSQIEKGPTINPIGNNNEITNTDEKVTISNCYCLKGNGFYKYNTAPKDAKGITIVDTAKEPLSNFITKLQTSFPNDTSDSRYDATAYGTDLNNPGVYPLAAVVKHGQNYVHYGKVNGLIKYEVDDNLPPFGSVEVKVVHGTAEEKTRLALPGKTVKLTVKPDNDRLYELESLTITDSKNQPVTYTPEFSTNVTEYSFTMPEGKVDVNAVFRSISHRIICSCDSEKGFITCEKANAVKDTPIEFTVTAKSGWVFNGDVSVTTADGDVDGVTFDPETGKYSFTMPNADVTVSAEFEEEVQIPAGKHRINVVIDPEVGGTVECPQFAAPNEYVNFKINVSEGYIPLSAELDTGTSFTVGEYNTGGGFHMPDKDVTLTVRLVRRYNITVNPSNNGGVSVSGGLNKAIAGTKIVLNISPYDGYRLASLVVNENIYPTRQDDGTYTFTMPASDVTVSAEFEQIPYSITVNKQGNGTVTCVNEAPQNTTVTVTITPDEGWQFASIEVKDSWNNSITCSSNDGNQTFSFTMPNTTVTISVVFVEKIDIGESQVGLFVAEWSQDWQSLSILPKFPDKPYTAPSERVACVGILVDNSITLDRISVGVVYSYNANAFPGELAQYADEYSNGKRCGDVTSNYSVFENYHILVIKGANGFNYNCGNDAHIVLKIDGTVVLDMGAIKENW